MRYFKYIALSLVLFIFSCSKPKPSPRSVAYFRLNLPQKQYISFNPDSCPYSFDLPVYAKVVPDSDEQQSHHCWMTIVFPSLKAAISVTYYPVEGNLDQLVDDSYTLAYKHSIRADDITEKEFINKKANVYATVFNITGNAASPMQFHITDSTKHFFRGSLYFRARPNRDSLAPAIKFIEKDIIRMIESFRWK